MPDNRPNVLFIMTDQQRGDALGIEGHPVLQTPVMDWIGTAGARFSSAYTASPICVAARRTVMTGQKPSTRFCFIDCIKAIWARSVSMVAIRSALLSI